MQPIFDESWLAGSGTTPIQLDFDFADFDGPEWVVRPLRHRKGWLVAAEARRLTPFEEACRTIIVGVTDHGEPIGPLRGAALLSARVRHGGEPDSLPPSELAEQVEPQWRKFIEATDRETFQHLEDEEASVAAAVEAAAADFQAMRDKIEAMQQSLQRERRSSDVSIVRRAEIGSQLDRLDGMLDQLREAWPQRAKAIRSRIDGLPERAFAALKRCGTIEPIWIVRWREWRPPAMPINHWHAVGVSNTASSRFEVARILLQEADARPSHRRIVPVREVDTPREPDLRPFVPPIVYRTRPEKVPAAQPQVSTPSFISVNVAEHVRDRLAASASMLSVSEIIKIVIEETSSCNYVNIMHRKFLFSFVRSLSRLTVANRNKLRLRLEQILREQDARLLYRAPPSDGGELAGSGEAGRWDSPSHIDGSA